MAFNLTCPQCGRRMIMDFSISKVLCQHCGYVRPDEIAHLDEVMHAARAQGERPHVDITHQGEISPSALAAFETGQEWLFKGNKPAALKSFYRAIDCQPDFVDAHLWIARTSDDPKEKREHLDTVLAEDPSHLEAIRLLMVLNGRLTPDEAAPTYHDDDATVQSVSGEVAAKAAGLKCPNCGGELTINERTQQIECRFCGYIRPQTSQPIGGDLLAMALLERKAHPVRWNVGRRLVKCQQCGAEHTIPADRMTERCRFCGSTAVILTDALGSFTQPDGLIAFCITQDEALAGIEQQLHSLGERIAGFFSANKVEQSTVEGVYLPFWVFDATVQVRLTRTVGDTSSDSQETELVNDVPVCAVKSPSPSLTAHLVPYDLSAAVAYEPKWLAKHPAQLYSVDFDAASLEARAIVSRGLKAKHDQQIAETKAANHYRTFQSQETLTITTQVQSMSFQLVLLPVWTVTLFEEDGDVRLALVNGQTGKTVLGKTHKPPQ